MMFMRQKKKALVVIAGITVIIFIFMAMSGLFSSRKYSKYIPVFVVEEHHEALPYWVEVAYEGVIPQRGNTLIHIDGHADDAIPYYVTGFPFFKWPTTELEVDLIMQQNDIFILGSIIIGLIHRFIWITPEWNNDTKDVIYDITEVEVGWTTVKINGQQIIHFCTCSLVKEERPDSIEHQQQIEEPFKKCVYFNHSFQPPDNPEILLEMPSLCNIKTKYISEVLPAKTALEYMNSNNEWLKVEESIILDIEEDYFGCESLGRSLYNAGFNWRSLQFVNEKLKLLFCPKYIDQELTAATIMTKILTVLLEDCDNLPEEKIEPNSINSSKTSVDDILNDIFKTLLSSWMEDPLLYCARNNGDLRKSTRDVLVAFYKLSSEQIKAILKLGFCFNTSPRTLWFEEEGHLVICHGNNDPDEPMVQVYVPETPNELSSSIDDLTQLLDSLPQPKAVSVCRSIRDGYTPRSIHRHVEHFILSYFKSPKKSQSNEDYRYEDIYIYKIIYDENLLNGTHGLSTLL